MISPRNAFITLLKEKKVMNCQKNHLISLKSKKITLPTDSSLTKCKLHIPDKQKSQQKIRKSSNMHLTTAPQTRNSTLKFQINTTRQNHQKKYLTHIFSPPIPTHQNKYQQQQKKNKNGQNCRLLVKINEQQQNYYYIKVNQLADIKKCLYSSLPAAKYFTTIPRQISLQFLITQQNIPGEYLNGQTLYLKAQYENRQDKKIDRQNKLITLKDFEIIKQLGSGGFSKVFLCRSKIDNNFYAIKIIQKQMIVKNQKKGIIINQRNIMAKIHHPFLIDLKYAFQSEKYIVFVLQFCPGGQLFGVIKKYGKLTQDVAKFYIIEVLLGISYLHSQKVVYRDIKPQNILLGIDGHVKIADLGLAKPEMDDGKLAHSFCGSPEYMSPEMILQVGHTYPVDFYCAGALLYELLTGLPPFYSQDANQIYQAVLQQQLTFPIQTPLTGQCQNLLKGLLNKDPKQRLGSLYGIKQILVHPWFGKQNIKNFTQKKIKPPILFNKISKLNIDIMEKDIYKDNLIKILKDQKYENKQYKYIMNNTFYYNYQNNNELHHHYHHHSKLNIRQINRTERKFSQNNKIKISLRRSLSKQNKQNIQTNRKMKKKKNSIGNILPNSLQCFFKK